MDSNQSTRRVFTRDRRDKIRQIQNQTPNVLELDVFVTHNKATYSSAGGYAASATFKVEHDFVALGHFTVNPEHRLATAKNS
ncbi:MAG TPA: hypothetical protein VH598_00635, partial [Verrucomicrobiae bacterium]|nr:hypothetical protein [Verrucomicrobiae bacterium]